LVQQLLAMQPSFAIEHRHFMICHMVFFFRINFSPKYEAVLNALEDAKSHSLQGGDCAVYNW
jgi:hypothetical protein